MTKKGQHRILVAWLRTKGLKEAPRAEWMFHHTRKWRFDYAWPEYRVAIEVQGGVFSQGRHVRGAALMGEYEKLNEANLDNWCVLLVTPQQLMTDATYQMIRCAILNAKERMEIEQMALFPDAGTSE